MGSYNIEWCAVMVDRACVVCALLAIVAQLGSTLNQVSHPKLASMWKQMSDELIGPTPIIFCAGVSLHRELWCSYPRDTPWGFRHSNYFDGFLLVVIMYCVYLDMIRR